MRGIYNLSIVVTERPIFLPGPLQGETQDLHGAGAVDGAVAAAVLLDRRLDAELSQGLFDLPDGGASLAFRHLKRSQVLGLPSGQNVAKAR